MKTSEPSLDIIFDVEPTTPENAIMLLALGVSPIIKAEDMVAFVKLLKKHNYLQEFVVRDVHGTGVNGIYVRKTFSYYTLINGVAILTEKIVGQSSYDSSSA